MSSFEFLRADADGAIARSPMEGSAIAAGARMEVRDGWNVAVDYADQPGEGTVAWADVSHLRKVEVHGRHELTPGLAKRSNDAWWCPITRDRTLVIGDAGTAEGVPGDLGGPGRVDGGHNDLLAVLTNPYPGVDQLVGNGIADGVQLHGAVLVDPPGLPEH